MRKRIGAAAMVFFLAVVFCFGSGFASFADEGKDASAFFHASISASKDSYTSGETAVVQIKYTIEEGMIAPGDFVLVTIPEEIMGPAKFSVSRQHFSSVEDIGGGKYRLTFGENASTALSGSMSMRCSTHSDDEKDGVVSAGDSEITIRVIGNSPGGSGTGTYENEAIMKDGLGNEGMQYGGYDYSNSAGTQIGIFDSSSENEFIYRLYVNRKNVSMNDVTVTDTLPDGMYFAGGPEMVTCRRLDPSSMLASDEIVTPESVTISGQKLIIRLGDIDYPLEISYRVRVPAQKSVKLRNDAEITYTQDGKKHGEHQDYIAQSSDYSAANGVKSVDKTEISTESSDQWVTYVIRFWNENGFEKGEISLTDKLDGYIDFLYADESDIFDVTQDPSDSHKLKITNREPVPASTEVFVSFVCDFSRVPAGYTVENTVGGNTTKTKKVGAVVPVSAVKTVNGEKPKGVFTFGLYDNNGKLLQKAANDEDGNIEFRDLAFTKADLGKTFSYRIREIVPDGSDGYIYDESDYMFSVTVAEEVNEDGTIDIGTSLTVDGRPEEKIIFDNKVKPEEPIVNKISIPVSKLWDDDDDRDRIRPEEVTVHLLADGVDTGKTLTLDAQNSWSGSFEELDECVGGKQIDYKIEESYIEGYRSEVTSDGNGGFIITNTHELVQEEPEKPDTPYEPDKPDQPDQPGTTEEPAGPEENTTATVKPAKASTKTDGKRSGEEDSKNKIPAADSPQTGDEEAVRVVSLLFLISAAFAFAAGIRADR